MHKIPTIFNRGPDFKVIDEVKPECQWVLDGEGIATEKLDGTNVRVTIRSGQLVRLEKRRNPTKVQKKKGIVDGWYVDADRNDPADRYIWEAIESTYTDNWPDGEHSCEAVGPKIQGNPLVLDHYMCVPFTLRPPVFEDAALSAPRSYHNIKYFLETADSVFSPGRMPEGIVFHHPDGRMAKIKRKDFA